MDRQPVIDYLGLYKPDFLMTRNQWIELEKYCQSIRNKSREMKKLLTNEEAVKKILKEQFDDTEINLWALVEIRCDEPFYDNDGEELPSVCNCVYINPDDKLVHVCDIDGIGQDWVFRELDILTQRDIIWMMRKTWEEIQKEY